MGWLPLAARSFTDRRRVSIAAVGVCEPTATYPEQLMNSLFTTQRPSITSDRAGTFIIKSLLKPGDSVEPYYCCYYYSLI